MITATERYRRADRVAVEFEQNGTVYFRRVLITDWDADPLKIAAQVSVYMKQQIPASPPIPSLAAPKVYTQAEIDQKLSEGK